MSAATERRSFLLPAVSLVVVAGVLAALVLAFAYVRQSRPAEPTEPLFADLGIDLGRHTRKVTTDSPLAQRYFDQGLAFLYGFNYTEAARSFDAAAACDPRCAMAYWGIAIANGDAITDPSADEPLAKTAVDALANARELSGNATPVESELIDA